MVAVKDSQMHPVNRKTQPELLAAIIDVLAEDKIISGAVYFCCFNEEGGTQRNGQVILIDKNEVAKLSKFMNVADLETFQQGYHQNKFKVEKQKTKKLTIT